uniref:Ig-like domain-containing protein n=1 Tax=Monopterus albus TaxID=43700 RepID=A0A3Q3IP98_MONAL
KAKRCYLISITSNPGHTVILPCRVPSSRNITTVKWMRTDLWFENVLKYQDGQLDLNNQHLSFKDRVELEDSEMKDGDMSLALRDVTTGDSGIYACVLIQERITDTEFISFINLNVKPGESDQTEQTQSVSVSSSDMVRGRNVHCVIHF